jgi:hypothetical protein
MILVGAELKSRFCGDTGYLMLDGRFPKGVALRKDARCWLDRSVNPAFAGIPITGY